MDNSQLTEKLAAKKAELRKMGGDASVARQHSTGKLSARERIQLLCDENTFQEWGLLVHHTSQHPQMAGKATPADGVVCGQGRIDGRPVTIIAYDFTVMGGSMGINGEKKVSRMREIALERLTPIIWLLDSAGARIQELAGSQFAGTGGLFKDQVTMSGMVPQIAAVMGPTAAGTSYIGGLADFVPMVKGSGSMGLAGPALVKAAINEDISVEDLGGSKVHTEKSGVAHLECADDRECIEAIQTYLSYFPSNFRETIPVQASQCQAVTRSDEIFTILPDSSRKAYDVIKVIKWLADEDSLFEYQPKWARNIVTGFMRLDGIGMGVIANQPCQMGGAIDLDASDKAARFINLCDAFGIPVLFLHDCPGFWVGSKMEHAGIIRHGAKMVYAVSRMTVPKISVVMRKSFGAGYYVMCGKGFDPDMIVAWPGAEISLMSAEGAVNIIAKEGDDREALLNRFRELIGVELSAMECLIDDVIDPRETAQLVVDQLRQLIPVHDKYRAGLAAKKHDIFPV